MGNWFEDDAVETRVDSLPGRNQLAFAAFWTGALAPSYEQLAAHADVRSAEAFEPYLHMVWDAALGQPPAHDTVGRAQHFLVHACPEIDVHPAFGYPGMEYTAALWDALETIHGESRAVRCRQAFADVLYHALIRRDVPDGAVIASNDRDPFGLMTDPLWLDPSSAGEQLLATLEQSELSPGVAENLRAEARILGESLALQIARLADERRAAL